MRATRWLCPRALAASLVVAGCAHAPAVKPVATRDAAGSLLDDVKPTLEQIAALRGLREKAPVKVRLVDDAAFRDALTARTQRLSRLDVAQNERAMWLAFGFERPPPPPPQGAPSPPPRDPEQLYSGLIDEQVLGFYDEGTGALYVRQHLPTSVDNVRDVLGGVLAHELEHALQDQHFSLADLAAIENPDERLARRSVYEGDAMLVMSGVTARRQGKATGPVLEQSAEVVRLLPTSALVQLSGHSPKLLEAPAIVRESLLFPYVWGMVFMNDLFRTGGFALVDRVFATPPRTSEQILHPQKYLDGEGAIDVAAPEVPAGWRVVASGTMGELGALTMLAECVSLREAKHGAEGWGGDRYAVIEGPKKTLGLLWSTVWDDAAAAERFAFALRRLPRCWQRQGASAAASGSDYAVSDDQLVAVDGAKVGFVRGLPSAMLQPTARALLALPRPRVTSAPPFGPPGPFGRITLVPPPPSGAQAQPASSRGRVDGRRYVSERLNVSAQIPDGFAVQDGDGKAELQILRAGSLLPGGAGRAVGVFATIRSAVTPALEEQYFTALAGAFTAGLTREQTLRLERQGAADVAFGRGKERVWSVDHTPTRLRATILPTCDGRALYVFAEVWTDDGGLRALDAWLASFKPLADHPAPLCKEPLQ